MRRLLLTLSIIFSLSVFVLGQTVVPQGMNYQAVARDAVGQVMANQDISMKISLLAGSADGKTVYTEYHQVTTNNIGLFSLTIGEGKTSKKTFAEVPWSSTEVWLDIALAEGDDASYNSISTTRLLAVPYAFHAGTAGEVTGAASDEKLTGPFWKSNGNQAVTAPYQFLGTVDNNPLLIKTNNQERMTIAGNGDISMSSPLSLQDDFSVDGIANFNNTTESTTKDNGSVILDGGIGVEKNANIGGDMEIDGTLGVDGVTSLKNTTESTSKDDGALVVEGGAGIEKNANIGGELNVAGKSSLNDQVTITADLEDAASGDGYDLYPLRVQGSAQGIAIEVENVPASNSGRSNNYISFWKNGNMKGRVEGMSNFDLDPTGLTDLIFDDFLSVSGQNANIGISVIGDIVTNGFNDNTNSAANSANNYENTVPTQTEIDNFNDQISSNYVQEVVLQTTEIIKTTIMFAASVLSILDPEDVFSTGVDLSVQLINMAIYLTFNITGVGVAYESGAGDYAEWLLRANEKEMLTPGEVVGVVGGTISKAFTDAEKFMVISTAPAVLGNMQEIPSMEFLHEKVAFMGQVPVKVIGEVNIGDYILPSGNGDGFAIAVAPEEMKAKDYGRIVGIAWQASDGKKAFDYVNTAVGINSNDMADMMDYMQSVMNEMQLAIKEVNPNYEPTIFNVAGRPTAIADNYTVAPTMNQHILSQLQIDGDASLEEKMRALKQYTYESDAGEYLEHFPYLYELMENPNDMDLVNKVITEYTQALQNAQALTAAIENARINGN